MILFITPNPSKIFWELLLCQAERLELCEEFWKTDPSIEKYFPAIVNKNACFYTSTLQTLPD